MLVMQFSQEGIDELRKYQEHMEMRHPEGDFVLSDGFDEGVLGFIPRRSSRSVFTNGCGAA
jgi:serine/threonine-protein kinase ULK/ATG1